MAPLVRTGGSRHTGLAALPHRNIQFQFGYSDFYFISLKKMINCPTDHKVFFYDNTAAINITKPEDKAILKLMNTSGKIFEIPIPNKLGSSFSSDIILKDNLCLIHATQYPEEYFISYDLTTNTFSKMNIDSNYSDKINWDALPDYLSFNNKRLVLPLTGDDNNSYVMVLDNNWNVILKPVEGYSEGYTCQKLVIETDTDTIVYDEAGEILFTLSDKGYEKSDYQNQLSQKCPVPYSDDVMTFVIIGSYEPAYLDEHGDKLFSKINTSNTKLKSSKSYKSK